jgi:glycosyltransferase involved in cell wall biosynthesis
MPTLADALVLVFTRGVSLRTWVETGGVDRELALYERLLDVYPRIVLATYGGPDDAAILRAHTPAPERYRVVTNSAKLSLGAYADLLPSLVAEALGEARRIVVKTNQMQGGEVAVAITRRWIGSGRTAALIARGGYLWSRMAAYEHGPESPQARSAGATEAALCAAADVVIGTTPDMTHDLAWRYGLEPRRTILVPNYVVTPDTEPPDAAAREPGLILYAGQVIRRKRIDVLIDAVANLPDEIRSRVMLEVVGDGMELPALRERASASNAPVVFRERMAHHDLLRRMGECSIYAQASEMEGHPKTVLEALSAGAPTLVADSPGLASTVLHGVTGLRVHNSAGAFGQAIGELLADPDWRDMLGVGAARAARAAFSLDAIVPRELEAHERALAAAENPGGGVKQTVRTA